MHRSDLRPSCRRVIAAAAIVAAQLFASSGAAAQQCAEHTKDVELDKTTAVADMWANWREKDGSIQAETKKMLKAAEAKLSAATAPSDLCPSGCKPVSVPRIIFQSVPNKFIADYSDEAHCNELAQRTASKPIVFPNRRFKDVDSLTAWFGEFSQGKGNDGSALYAQCDGSCSPQYHCDIKSNGSGLVLDAAVRCGAARDKDDNKYRLSVAYRWSCAEE